tara:strand:+ start:32 stop:361 length:330 start_codon:yes stop_codon:yes gene_type:complete
METIITEKKVKCDNCSNYIRQPKYHKEMIGICCFKCFKMAKHKYYEIVIFKYFQKVKELEEENIKLKKRLGIAQNPRMPKPELKKDNTWKEYKSITNFSKDGKIIVSFD